VHRSLPQRAQGAADDRARRRFERAAAGDAERGPYAQAEHQDLRAQLRQALEALPITLRTAVVLRDLQELSYQEIADRLGLPEGTVKSRINRGRIELAHQLSGCRTISRSTAAGAAPRRPRKRSDASRSLE
jgi:RNA polymerase sigma-70 factor (ECF subfamily)